MTRFLTLMVVLLGCERSAHVELPARPADGSMDAASDTAVSDSSLDAALADATDSEVDDATADTSVADGGVSAGSADIRLRFGNTERQLTRSYYGRNQNGSLHVEAYAGAPEGCPSMTSPSPLQTLILENIATTATNSTSATVNLLDFEGVLLSRPVAAATSSMYSSRGTDVIDIDLAATFEGGSAMGGLAASHCTSLDE